MKYKLPLIFLLVLFGNIAVSAQGFSINSVEPPNWWSGMKWNTVQLMIYGDNLNDVNVSTSHPEIKVINIFCDSSRAIAPYLIVNNLDPIIHKIENELGFGIT